MRKFKIHLLADITTNEYMVNALMLIDENSDPIKLNASKDIVKMICILEGLLLDDDILSKYKSIDLRKIEIANAILTENCVDVLTSDEIEYYLTEETSIKPAQNVEDDSKKMAGMITLISPGTLSYNGILDSLKNNNGDIMDRNKQVSKIIIEIENKKPTKMKLFLGNE